MSLADQLSQIAGAAQGVALGRKYRSKLHSVSFLYDPAYAAGQDYESIFTEALDGLRKLVSIDGRFGAFADTIFRDQSVSADREVMSQEDNTNLDKTIDSFLTLLGPYWHLAISVKAAEWPLRRFAMNMHNAETLLLSTLPYFGQPLFQRVLYVIPKLPPLFGWLAGFKKAQKCPTRAAILRAFADTTFFNLYSKFINKEVARHVKYSKQIVFYVTISATAIAGLSSSGSSKLTEYVPLALESVNQLLASDDYECSVGAYTLLAVVSSAVPLSRDITLACIDTILLTASDELSQPALQCILKLYQGIQSNPLDPLPLKTMGKLPKDLLTSDSADLSVIVSAPHSNAFVTSYLRTLIQTNSDLSSVSLEDLKLTRKQLSLLTTDAIHQAREEAADRSQYVGLLKHLIAQDKKQFFETLTAVGVSLSDLEMIVQSTLVEEVPAEQQPVPETPVKQVKAVSVDSFAKKLVKTETETFFTSDKATNEEFSKLEGVYLESITLGAQDRMLSECFASDDSRVSFLLRVACQSTVPVKGRVSALQALTKQLATLDESVLAYSILAALSTLLSDSVPSIREQAVAAVQALSEQGTAETESILLPQLYGKEAGDVALIGPKEASGFFSLVLERAQDIKLDAGQFAKVFGKIAKKKRGSIILAFFVAHANSADVPDIKAKLMKTVATGCAALKNASTPSEIFEEILSSYISDRSNWKQKCLVTGSDFVAFESEVLGLITKKETDSSALGLLESSLSSSQEDLAATAEKKLVDVFPSLEFGTRIHIINHALDEGLKDKTPVTYDVVELMEALNMDDAVFVKLLKDSVVGAANTQATNVAKRRRRSSAAARQAMKEIEVSSLANLHLRKVTALLDVLQFHSSKDTFKPSLELLRLLFTILDDLETLSNSGNLPVLYTQETLASCMLNVINHMTDELSAVEDTSTIRADIIVSSIRATDSPQAQNRLLLVIASLAQLSPELVLHSVMPIFTFMGAHTIRQDDEFSTHVVEETIRCVVPALAKTARNGVTEEVEFLLASFVSAFPHVPRHRRVRLFTTLARTLGSQLSVYLILFLCGQQYASAYAVHQMATCSALIDFSSTFLQAFSPNEQLSAARKYLSLWKDIPEDAVKSDSKAYSELTSRIIFGPSIVNMNKSELYNMRKGLVSYLRHSLIAAEGQDNIPRLRLKVAAEFLQTDEPEQLTNTFSGLIEDTMGLIDEYSNSFEDEEILEKFYKLLANVLSLLPIRYFVKSVLPILNSKTASTRTKKHVTELAASKFDVESGLADNPYVQSGIAALLPVFLENAGSDEHVELSQTSMETVSTLIQDFRDKLDTSLLMQSLDVAVSDKGLLNKDSPELVLSSINCIATVVDVTGVKTIGYFPKIIAPVFTIFESTLDSDDEETAKFLQVSVLVLYSALARRTRNLITPNVRQFMDVTFRASLASDEIRNSVLNGIIECVDAKTSFTTLCKLWDEVSKLDEATIGVFLSGLEQSIKKLDRKMAVSQAALFTTFLKRAMEFQATSEFDVNTTRRIAATVSECGIAYVMKLNDKTFRPLFASLVRWAFDGEGVTEQIEDAQRMDAFVRFFNKIQESLRSFVTSYYSYMLDSVVSLLGQQIGTGLKRSVYMSLAFSFKYDDSEFWQSSDRFNAVSKALCDNLASTDDTLGKHLVRTITNLVRAAPTEEFNKHVSELLMAHMTATCKPTEKLWTVRVLKSIYRKVGESWLSVLPQLVPLIAELLEDDDEQVEMEVRTGLAKVIENVLGEPLERYLE